MAQDSKKCLNCSEYRNCRDSFASWIFFIIGIIATIAIRAVTLLTHLDPLYSKIAWYTGVCGFILFFIYKFRINQARAEAVIQRDLVSKVADKKQLSGQDYELVGALLCSLSSKKDRINYFFIFGLSALALALAVYMDFLR